MGEYMLMPKLDMSMKEGTIVTWLVSEGDDIRKGEYAVEVETGKVSIEVDNTALSGKVLKIYYEEGDTVEVNSPILYIGDSDETAPDKEEAIEYFRSLKKENSAVLEPHGFDYDAIIIGAGQAGYTFALSAAKYTDKIAVIERDLFGGVCLNRGCIPSRILGKRVKILSEMKDQDLFDISSSDVAVNYPSMAKKKDELIFRLRQSMKHTLGGMCDVYEEEAKILSPHMIRAGSEIISSRYIIIASGSHPVLDEIKTDGSVKILTTEDVLCMDKLPETAVLCGQSAYIIEEALMLKSFGTDVTVIGNLNITDDSYIDRQIRKSLQKHRIRLIGDEVSEILGGEVILSGGERIKSDIYVYENKRKANIIPSETDITLTHDGFYSVDENYKTDAEDIYAIGDGNGLSLTAQGAGSDGEELAEILFGGKEAERKVYPKCINMIPKVAYGGYFEKDLEERGISYISAKRSFSSLPAAMASMDSGFAKIICDAQFGEILGFQVVAENADDIISSLTLAMKNELTVNELAKNVFVHPSVSEIISTVCGELKEKLRK